MKHFMSFLSGAIVGGAVALLLAPEKGEKTRKELKKYAKKIKKDLDVHLEEGGRKLQELREVGVERFGEIRTATEEFVEDAAKRINKNSGAA